MSTVDLDVPCDSVLDAVHDAVHAGVDGHAVAHRNVAQERPGAVQVLDFRGRQRVFADARVVGHGLHHEDDVAAAADVLGRLEHAADRARAVIDDEEEHHAFLLGLGLGLHHLRHPVVDLGVVVRHVVQLAQWDRNVAPPRCGVARSTQVDLRLGLDTVPLRRRRRRRQRRPAVARGRTRRARAGAAVEVRLRRGLVEQGEGVVQRGQVGDFVRVDGVFQLVARQLVVQRPPNSAVQEK